MDVIASVELAGHSCSDDSSVH